MRLWGEVAPPLHSKMRAACDLELLQAQAESFERRKF